MFSDFQTALSSGDIQGVISSTVGQLIIAIIGVALLLLAMVFAGNRKKTMNIKALTYSAIAIAISFVLSQLAILQMPQGGKLTLFSMLFIMVIGYFFGPRTGVLAGIVYGLLQLAIGGWVMHPIQLLLDYPLAYGALGLSGLFANSKHGLAKGVLVGAFGRFLCHFLAGAVFFAEYAPEGWNTLVYSFWYNFSYVGVEGILTAIIVIIPAVAFAFGQVKKQALN